MVQPTTTAPRISRTKRQGSRRCISRAPGSAGSVTSTSMRVPPTATTVTSDRRCLSRSCPGRVETREPPFAGTASRSFCRPTGPVASAASAARTSGRPRRAGRGSGLESRKAPQGWTSRARVAAPLTPQVRWLPSKPEMSRPDRTIILDARALSGALQRMAVEVLELAHGTDRLVLIGIQRRGVELAQRIARLIEKDEGVVLPPPGAPDLTLYPAAPETVGPKPDRKS